MKIAITGGIAEGKSTVLAHIQTMGYEVASADQIAKQIMEKESVWAQIEHFAPKFANLPKAEFRAAVFTDETLRRSINRLVHPLVMDEIQRHSARFVEVPLLLEACIQGEFERVWVVTCGREEQRRRLIERVQDEVLAERQIESQLDSEIKCAFADEVIRTNLPRPTVVSDVRRLVEREFAK